MQTAPFDPSGIDRRWRVRVVAVKEPAAPDPEGALASTPLGRPDIWITTDGDRVVARFDVTGADVAGAVSSAMQRWNEVGAFSGLSAWPVDSFTVDRHDPDRSSGPRRSRTAIDEEQQTVDLRRHGDCSRSEPRTARVAVASTGGDSVPAAEEKYLLVDMGDKMIRVRDRRSADRSDDSNRPVRR